MNYEKVNLKEKKVAGLMARTNNGSPDMERVIGGLWERFYRNRICSHKVIGIYTDYAGNEKDDYSVIAACEVESDDEIPEGIVVRTIPAGAYARFIVRGHMKLAVAEFWQELWKMDLPRSFVCDFEEYQNSELEDAEIHIYIGLKE